MMQLHISYHLLKEPEYLQMSKLFREWLQQPQPSIAPILSNWVTLDKGSRQKKSTYYGTLSHKAEFELRPKRTNHFTKEKHLENSRRKYLLFLSDIGVSHSIITLQTWELL